MSTSFVRRSARNHRVAEDDYQRVSKAKAAPIKWEDHPDLLSSILVAMEVNRRWRLGIFGDNIPPHHRERCLMEMARHFLLQHPELGEAFARKPTTFAKAVGLKLESLVLEQETVVISNAGRKGRAGKGKGKATVKTLSNKDESVWRQKRMRHDTLHTNASWHPLLPPEVQKLIILSAITSSDDNVEIAVARDLRLVNSAWREFVDPYFFRKVTLSKESHFESLFNKHGHLAKRRSPGSYLKTLKVLSLPPSKLLTKRALLAFEPEEIHYDMSRARQQYDNSWEVLSGECCQVEYIAKRCLPLYDILDHMNFKVLRLTWDDLDVEYECTNHRPFWRDMLGANLASLKIMEAKVHVIMDAELYAQVQAPVVMSWAVSPHWLAIIAIIREHAHHALNAAEGTDVVAGPLMYSPFDDTEVEELTLCSKNIHLLGILSSMIQSKQMKRINLTGWDPKLVEDEFIVSERKRAEDGLAGTVRWIVDPSAPASS